MAVLLLVRHATTAATGSRLGGWTPGVHLDEGGVAQAEATAARLVEHELAAVYASPLERTQDTAEIIASAAGLDVCTRDGLGETDYGEWTDRPLAELRQEPLWKVIQSTPSRAVFPGGESLRGSQQRMVEQLEELAADHDDHDLVVAVSHADPIKAAVAHFLGMPLDAFQRIAISPASVTVVVLPDGRAPTVVAVNQAHDLQLPSPPDPDESDDSDGSDESDGSGAAPPRPAGGDQSGD